jgi:DegT/DnrJ/EryC1/StrS aminotransferase family
VTADVLVGVYPTMSLPALAGRRSPRTFPFDRPTLRLTHLGRGAVWLALRALGLGPGSRLAMPAYHCGSEVEAARLAGVTVTFYRVDGALRVDEGDLARAAAEADAVYLISHFGFPTVAPPAGVPVIEDAAHALFSSDGREPIGARADAAVFCPRKSLGVPDGGALLVASPSRDDGDARRRPPPRRIVRSLASLVAGRAALAPVRPVRRAATAALFRASRADAAAREGRLAEVVIGEWDLEVADMEVAASSCSRMTAWSVGRVDAAAIRERRRRNYAALVAELEPACLDGFRALPDGVCPLYLPVLAADRPRAMAELIDRGVRAVEIWPVPHPLLDRVARSELEPLRRGLLALPVHQDLEPWHVEAVARAAKEVLRP